MEETERLKMTALDSQVSSSHLQMMKAMIPYVHTSGQVFLAIFVKFLEFKNTIDFFTGNGEQLGMCSLNAQSDDPLDMLNDIREYCTDEEREMMDTMLNLFQGMRMYQMFQQASAASAGTSGEEGGEGSDGKAEQGMGGSSPDPTAMMKAMLSPEQQAMFDTYSAMLSNLSNPDQEVMNDG